MGDFRDGRGDESGVGSRESGAGSRELEAAKGGGRPLYRVTGGTLATGKIISRSAGTLATG